MRGGGLTGLLVAVMAITCFLFDGQAAEVTINKPQRAIKLTIQPKPSLKQTTLLPDLVVENIWLDSRNYIVLMLKNIGKGFLEDVQGRGNVRVLYGDSH